MTAGTVGMGHAAGGGSGVRGRARERARVRWLLTRWQTLLLTLLGVTVALRLLTYSAWADGPWDPYLRGTAVLAVAAGVAWLVVRLASGPRSVLPLAAAIGVLLPADVVHFVRLTHPLSRTLEFRIEDRFDGLPAGAPPSEARWLPEVRPGASVGVEDGRLVVRSPANTVGFVGLRLNYELDPNRRLIGLPRGAFGPPAGETLEWEGRVVLEGRSATVLDTRTVRIEATEFGLRVRYLLLDGRIDGTDVEAPDVPAGAAVRYRLERLPERPLQRLLLGEREVWARPKPPGTWEFARFGATRADAEQGGLLTIDDVRYSARFSRSADTAESSCPGGALFC